MIESLRSEGVNVVTKLEPAPTFYPAEDYHQNYYANNPTQAYCNFAIPPKLAKLRANFAHLLKTIKMHNIWRCFWDARYIKR